MDLSQLDLISQHEDDCSLTHIELDDVVPIEWTLKMVCWTLHAYF
jgi:hypothetical protein